MRDVGMLLNVPIDCTSLRAATQNALDAIDRKANPIVFACANPHSIVVAQTDPAFLNALQQANLVVPDGVGVTVMAKVAGIRVGPRITGADYFVSIMGALKRRGFGRVFFFGSSPTVLDLIARRFVRDFPSLTLCGTYSPPFSVWATDENKRMLEAIKQAQPDVLWVGMTAPKQEKWVAENRDRLEIPVIGSIGAVFDFYAGTYQRAPRWTCRLGLEWMYRLMMEPKRTWRRTVISAPKFVALVICRHVLGFTARRTRESTGG